jgi:hypothetical protein
VCRARGGGGGREEEEEAEEEEEEEFHTLFERLKDARQNFFKYFRMSISKCENLKQLLPTDNQKMNARWRRSIRTEE